MVMVTRSARRRACEIFDDNSSDNSNCNVPPWCSSGRPDERKKPREIPSICEMRSSLLWPKNVWKIPYKNKSVTNSTYSLKGKIKSSREKTTKRVGKWKTLLFVLLILTVAFGAFLTQQMLRNTGPKSTNELLYLMGIRNDKSVNALDEECCYKMKLLSAALLRSEQSLRRTRRQYTLQLAAKPALDLRPELEGVIIAGAKATKGSGTEEWGGRAALWGIVPLWRASPPPHTLLALRKPTPADCWPFSGSRGEVIIELMHPLRVRSISVEHVRPDAARSAPRHFVLYAITENATWIKSLTGEYTFEGPQKQYFTLQETPPVKRIAFRVLSNHGNTRYTCVYRVHVYEDDQNET